mmetsp:Transcript_29540/g.84863  ORF Transcript_29540/g.84863 Transcript_29540/m.84863 type:complete len:200 (-) Transcript_29540:149-748(-)
MGLELIAICLRCFHGQANFPGARCLWLLRLGQESLDGLLRLQGNKAQGLEGGQLRKGDLLSAAGLLPVMRLLPQHLYRPAKRIDGLRVVRVQLVVLCPLKLADLGGGHRVAGPHRDILAVCRNLLCQLRSLRSVLLYVRLEHFDLLVRRIDGPLLLRGGVIAELLVSSKLDLFGMLLSLALRQHALHEFDDFLHGRDRS